MIETAIFPDLTIVSIAGGNSLKPMVVFIPSEYSMTGKGSSVSPKYSLYAFVSSTTFVCVRYAYSQGVSDLSI